MFRLLYLPFVAYKLVMRWADHKNLQVDRAACAEHENSHCFAAPKVQTVMQDLPQCAKELFGRAPIQLSWAWDC
jgi:hypothetical protein